MASRFKAECLALLDQVAESGSSYLVTKHGRPVARLVPLDDAGDPASLDGSVTVLTDEEDGLFTTGATWDSEAGS